MSKLKHIHSAGGIIVHNDKVLVITSALRGSVDFPKGKIEKGEVVEAAAIREIKEETGYTVEIESKLPSVTYDFEKHGELRRKTVDYFLMRIVEGSELVKNLQPGEDFENLWLNYTDALEQLTYQNAKNILKSIL